MKPKGRGTGWLILLILATLAAAGCGSGGSSTQDLSSGNGGTGVSSIYSSPAELGVGDFMLASFDSTGYTLDFEGVADGAQFILAVGNSSNTGSASTMGLSADVSIPDLLAPGKFMSIEPVEEDDAYEANEIFSAWLRASESVLEENELPLDMVNNANFKGMSAKAAGLGERENFRVLASLTNTSSYVTITGDVKCVGQNVVFYIDNTVPSENLSDADIQELCDGFDADAGEMESFLGAGSDVDSDGKLHVLMTSQINKLGALGGGIITGYFYAADLYARSDSNPVSNEREIIYTMVPDPSGVYGTAVDHDFAMENLLPAVLPHELQHATSYNQHVFVQGGAAEDNWLNEGMSHLIEDVMGYNRENPSRYALYLSSPSVYGIVTQSSPNLLERGGSYLFLRYLYEQSDNGKAFMGRLEQTFRRGVDNVLNAFQGNATMDAWDEMMALWSVALIMTDRGISQDSRYIYQARTRHAETGNWLGVILEGDADDGRGTVLDGVNLNSYSGSHTASIDGSTAKYFNISTVPAKIDVSGSTGSQGYVTLVRYQ
ncbi:MAG: hypothetical protein ABH871_05005 [Pseudomonadota bacterium]